MKFKILFLLIILVSTVAFAQTEEKNEKRVYDYSETKHELAVNVLSILKGEAPSSLFYRKNYIGPNGNTMGFRANMIFQNEFNSNFLTEEAINFKRTRELSYEISMGLERQKFINNKFIAYGGADLGFAYGNSRFSDSILFPGDNGFLNIDVMRYSITNFWGFKYHFNPRISFSAETGFEVFYTNSIIKTGDGTSFTQNERENGPNVFGVNLLPLKALRISYHF